MEGGREKEREICSLREAILFIGGVRERERRNAICCMCRCHETLHCVVNFALFLYMNFCCPCVFNA